jgi:hypothetical protein
MADCYTFRSMNLCRQCTLLHGKVRIISNRLYALIDGEVGIHLYPLPGMAHEREMEAPVTSILHTGKFCLEAGLYWIGTCHAIFGREVERLVVPLAIDSDNIIELRILRWRLNVFRFEDRLDEFIGLRGNFTFQRFWKGG